jgi:hypothetical protein
LVVGVWLDIPTAPDSQAPAAVPDLTFNFEDDQCVNPTAA